MFLESLTAGRDLKAFVENAAWIKSPIVNENFKPTIVHTTRHKQAKQETVGLARAAHF